MSSPTSFDAYSVGAAARSTVRVSLGKQTIQTRCLMLCNSRHDLRAVLLVTACLEPEVRDPPKLLQARLLQPPCTVCAAAARLAAALQVEA